MEWIGTADLVDWLVPAEGPSEEALCTFRDGSILLEALEVAAIPLPRPPARVLDFVCVSVGPASWCAAPSRQQGQHIVYPLSECIETRNSGGSLAFLEGPFDGVSFDLCLGSWHGFSCAPAVDATARLFQAHLTLETLLGDVLRPPTLVPGHTGVVRMVHFVELRVVRHQHSVSPKLGA